MEITFTAPALLFPAISLLFLAYTNRFMVLAQLIRQLHGKNRVEVRAIVTRQIENLRRRMHLIKAMQATGVLSFICCTLSIFALFLNMQQLGSIFLGACLLLLVCSLLLSLWEIQISSGAIELELTDMEQESDH